MPRTGKIVGTTTALGDYSVTIKAGNFLGYSPAQTLVLHEKPIAPTLSSIATDLTATNVLGTSATINFKIDDHGGQDANVTVYYDLADRDKNASAWTDKYNHATLFGAGSHNISLTGLSLGSLYHSGCRDQFGRYGLDGHCRHLYHQCFRTSPSGFRFRREYDHLHPKRSSVDRSSQFIRRK